MPETMQHPPVEETEEINSPVKPEIPKRKRRFGDRYDGYRVRNLDMQFYIIPNIMRSRVDSLVYFEEAVDITALEKYIRQKRQEGMTNLRLIQVVMAAMVRVMATRPRLNRFIAGKKIFAHNNMRFSLTIKRSMTADGEESEILPVFLPTDTIFDVNERFETALKETMETKNVKGEGNETDVVVRVLSHIPTWMKSFVVFALRNLDKIGLMPKAIYRASPFHSSCYVTDVGSIGIDAIYHHLYEFGTTSIFLAIGKKMTAPYVKDDGTLGERRIINFRFVCDERICDGFYYASSMKLFRRYLKHPELLELPPESLPDDM